MAKKRTVIEMDYDEFDTLVAKHIPALKMGKGRYEFCAKEECSNDSDHAFNGIKNETREEFATHYKPDADPKQIDEWYAREQKQLDEIIAGTAKYFGNHQVLEALCRLGAIEPGDYLVRVSW